MPRILKLLKLSGFLICICLISSAIKADWDDVLRAANANQSGSAYSKHSSRKISNAAGASQDGTPEGFSDELGTLKQSSSSNWDDALHHQKGVSENDHLSGQPKDVKDLLEKIAAIDNMLPDSSSEKAMLMSVFSQLFLQYGDFLSAERICLKSLRLAEKLTGKESYQTLGCLNALAKTYKYLGDYENEIPCIQEAYAIAVKNPVIPQGPKNSQDNITPANLRCGLIAMLAEAQLGVGLLQSSRENAEKALILARSEGSSNPVPLIVSLLANAKCCQALGNTKQAEIFLNEALSIIEPKYLEQKGISKWLEEKKPDPLFYHKNKAADPVLGTFYEGTLSDLAGVEVSSGNVESADRVIAKLQKVMRCENATSGNTTELARLQEYQSILDELQGKHAEGAAMAIKNFQNQDRFLSSALDLVESQRLAWQRENLNFTLPVQFCTPSQLAEYAIRWKGVVLDSLIIDRNNLRVSQSQALNKNLQELASLRGRLAQFEISSTGGNAAMDYNKKTLRDRVASIERSMAQRAGLMRQKTMSSVSLSAVQETLSSDAALIEFVAYRKFPDRRSGTPQLGALIIKRSSEPEWVYLGESKPIQDSLQQCLSNMHSSKATDDSLAQNLADVYNKVWEPLSHHLGDDVKKVILSPDGAANFVPFMSLLSPDGRFLSERYEFIEVGSGRDLLQKPPSSHPEGMCVIANPMFDSVIAASPALENTAISRSINWSNLGTVSFPPLPGTEEEAKIISSEASGHGVSASILMREKATKAVFLSLKPSNILHIATHGFYLEGGTASVDIAGVRGMTIEKSSDALPQSENKKESVRALNPMQESGLALAGAGDTIKAWQEGKHTYTENDGILTAEEVAGLDLNGTWLVTLSACETGVGQVQSGEGVFGLRRAFMMAGAQNLMMTLWPVSDDVTPKIMADFYREALATHDAPGSLAKVQRDWLVKLRQEKGLIAAVRDAGPFVMAITGKLPERNASSAPVDSLPSGATPPTPQPSAFPSPTPVQAVKEMQTLKKAA